MVNQFFITDAPYPHAAEGKEAKATGEQSGVRLPDELPVAYDSLQWCAFNSLFKGKQFTQAGRRKKYIPLCDHQGLRS